MLDPTLWQLVTVLLGGVSTIAIYTFLIRENAFYRFFEHLFIGIAAGFLPILSIRNLLWPKVLEPLLGLDIVQYPDGTFSKEYNSYLFLYFIPMVLGLFYYFIYSKKYGWLAKIAIGIALGVSGGMAFRGFFAEMMPQLMSSFKPLVVFSGEAIDVGQSVSNTLFIVILLAVMHYFFFTFRRNSSVSRGFASFGRWSMMVCFGAFFGSTVPARMALLVERMQFLIHDWGQAIGTLLH